MAVFMEWIAYLQYLGLADVLIPFFLVFAVAFGVLAKADVLKSKKFHVIIALSMAFAVVVPHVMWGTPDPTYPYLTTGVVDIVKLINNSLPEIAAVLIGIIMIALLLGAFGHEWKPAKTGGAVLAIIMVAIVGYIFASNAGWFGAYPWFLWWLTDYETQMLLVTLIVFGLVVWLITKEDKPENENKDGGKLIKEMFGFQE